MNKLVSACLLGSLMLIGLGGAATYEFGSKVAPGDTDIGRLLYNCAPRVMYWDTGINPGYDQGDPVYLHVQPTDPANPQIVNANDVRLTACGAYAAGTKVTSSDNDINKPLTSFEVGAFEPVIAYMNLYGGQGYDFDDPVYLHLSGDAIAAGGAGTTVTNDIRLNKVGGLNAGTKVLDYDPDHNKPIKFLTDLPYTDAVPTPARIRLYNANGNYEITATTATRIYDYPDVVYLDFSTTQVPEPYGSVVVNNVRLSV